MIRTKQTIRQDLGDPVSTYVNFTPVDLTDPRQMVGMYHWAPASRRNGITRRGFLPNSRSHSVNWRPPYTCFSLDPDLAWQLSGAMYPGSGNWDLWMTWTNVPSGIDLIIDYSPHIEAHYIKEIRVYERIFKRDIWLVGERAA